MDKEGFPPYSVTKRIKTLNGYINVPAGEPTIGDTIIVDQEIGYNIYSSRYGSGGGGGGGVSDSTKALETNNTGIKVVVNNATPPTVGQSLVATSSTNATWQTLVPGTASSSNVTKALATLSGPGNDVQINTSDCAGSGLVLVSTSATDAKWNAKVPSASNADNATNAGTANTASVANALATTGSSVNVSSAPTPLSAGQYLQTTGTGSTAEWAPLGTGQTIFGQLISSTNTATLGVTTTYKKFPGLAVRVANGITVSAANSNIQIDQQAYYDSTFDLSITGAGSNTFLIQAFANDIALGNPVEFSTTTPSATSWSSSFETLSATQLNPGDVVDVRIACAAGSQTITLSRVSHIMKGLITGIQGPIGPAGPSGTAGVMYESLPFGMENTGQIVGVANRALAGSFLSNGTSTVNKVDILIWENSNTVTTYRVGLYDNTGSSLLGSSSAVAFPTVNSGVVTRFTFTLTSSVSLTVGNLYWINLLRVTGDTSGTTNLYGKEATATNNLFFNRTGTAPATLPTSIAAYSAVATRYYFRVYG